MNQSRSSPKNDSPRRNSASAQLVADGLEVAEYLQRRLGKKKIILTGGSWGSVLAVHMVHERPDLFHAYVGVSQLVNDRDNETASYAATLEMAETKEGHDRPSPRWRRSVLRPGPIRATSGASAASSAATKTKSRLPARAFKISPEYASDADRAAYAAGEELSFLKYVGLKGDGMLAQVDLPALGHEVRPADVLRPG